MRFTHRTYVWITRRSEFRVRVYHWMAKKKLVSVEEALRRMKREELLMARVGRHIRAERADKGGI